MIEHLHFLCNNNSNTNNKEIIIEMLVWYVTLLTDPLEHVFFLYFFLHVWLFCFFWWFACVYSSCKCFRFNNCNLNWIGAAFVILHFVSFWDVPSIRMLLFTFTCNVRYFLTFSLHFAFSCILANHMKDTSRNKQLWRVSTWQHDAER